MALVLILTTSLHGWFGPPPSAGGLRLRLERTMDGKWVAPQADSSGQIDAICSVIVSRAPGWIWARAGAPSIKCELKPMANGEVGTRPTDSEVLAWWSERAAAGDEAATSGYKSSLSAADRASLLQVLAAGGRSIMRGESVRAIYMVVAIASCVALFFLMLHAVVRRLGPSR